MFVCSCGYVHVCFCIVVILDLVILSLLDDQLFVPSGDSGDEEETIDMEEESAAKVFCCCVNTTLSLHLSLGWRTRL